MGSRLVFTIGDGGNHLYWLGVCRLIQSVFSGDLFTVCTTVLRGGAIVQDVSDTHQTGPPQVGQRHYAAPSGHVYAQIC